MKKSYVFIIFLVSICTIAMVLFNAFVYFHQDAIFKNLFLFLEKPLTAMFEAEDAERLEKMERGEPTPGRDTMIIWNKKYDICKYYENNEKMGSLSISQKDFITECIISRIKNFEKRGNKLYVYSYDGYAVIDKENVCRVFITVPAEDFSRGYSADENGNKFRYYPQKVNHEKVKYLTSFNEFSEKEQKILKSLE